ncbi:MAG: bifunctional salicylyl-CoA 5-hydroxylase/oxidoreductase [Sandaracinus sp.]
MRVHVLGGGPAGLYLSILLKKRDPRVDVRVLERNPEGQTWGWGVVFSDETLGNLEEADGESYRAITDAFVRWSEIEVRAHGQTHRSGGHGFCGLSRRRLLQILEARAHTLGVSIQHQVDVTDVDALRKDCDLLVGADGLRSIVRKRWEDSFRPSLDPRKCRYVWLGTNHRFEAFTFSFRQNEHGLFQIHAYPFERETGTVIVECEEKTWLRAGLDRASEGDTLAYCEKLFAEDLAGGRLLSNRSLWTQFPTLKNERWSHENVVILGDAAHTAHFSIGSGTKLAMEDAIALDRALAVSGRPLAASLEAYELERKPDVGRIQTAAQQSLEWFETVEMRHDTLPVPQFLFSLFSRSRRITHANLHKRDAAFVDGLDRAFEERSGHERPEPARVRPRPPMFTPFHLRELALANRIVVSPMCQYSAEDGMPNDFHLVHLGSRAIGGAGLVFTEMTDVAPDARITPGCAGIWSDAHASAWKRIVDFVHRESDAKIGMQIGHAGRKGATKVLWEGYDEPVPDEQSWELVAPSPLAYSEAKKNQVPREMTRADMDRVRDQFVAATERAERAGFDLIELHMAHGYLLSTFLSPLTNHRTDAYGGSLEARMRYPLEVFAAMRAVWPAHKPMSVRLSATDWVPGGTEAADSVVIAAALAKAGCDVIDVSTGQVSPLEKPVYGRAFQTPFSERIRLEAKIPTIAVGNVQDYDQANSILLAGRADLVALARPHLADPYFTLHAAAAQGWDEVRWPKQYLAARPRRMSANG